jgi:two-component system nitrogen regulation sensor histidine kinase NtrY
MASARQRLGRIAGGFVTLGGISAVCYLILRLADVGPELELNQYLLPLLAITLVVLVLGLAGVLIRHLVKLVVERKRGIFGARLRSKLVLFFLALVLLPALVLFSGAVQLIKRTVEGMLRTPVEEVTRYSQEIVYGWTDHLKSDCLGRAVSLAGDLASAGLLDPERRRELAGWLERARRRERLDWIRVGSASGWVVWVGPQEPAGYEPRKVASRIDGLVQQAGDRGGGASRIDHLENGLLVHAVTPIAGGAQGAEAAAGTVAVGVVLPAEMMRRMEQVASARQDFRQFRVQRRELVSLYLYLITLIFLVTVFVAVWIGLYLARRITEPIQELASAAREIASGNLGVRVRSEVGDETGTLVDAFNEMAAELQQSREVITRSTADLKRSNKALEERRRYIDTLIAHLSTAVVSFDQHGRVTTANPAVHTILGLRLEAGEDIRSALARGRLEPLAELLDQALAHRPGSVRKDLVLVGPRGPASVSVQVSPLLGSGGEDLGTLMMVEDLTDLLRAQKAAAWHEVARRIAHEIRNPLTPIQLAAQRLRKKFTEGTADLGQVLPEATATIEQEVGSLKRLVDEFSRFARMPEVKPHPVDFRAVVDSVLALYSGMPGVSWELHTDPGLGAVVVDAEQMRRALINLIDNAVAAMNGQGTIRISVRPHAGPGSLRVEVSDSGPGIPPGDRDKMFAPYFSTKRRGTGLGLAIVHRVVTDHHGTIRVEDNEPRGARFVIEIPA